MEVCVFSALFQFYLGYPERGKRSETVSKCKNRHVCGTVPVRGGTFLTRSELKRVWISEAHHWFQTIPIKTFHAETLANTAAGSLP